MLQGCSPETYRMSPLFFWETFFIIQQFFSDWKFLTTVMYFPVSTLIYTRVIAVNLLRNKTTGRPSSPPPLYAYPSLTLQPAVPGPGSTRSTLFIWKRHRMPSPRSLCLHKLRVFIIHCNTAHSLFLCHLSLITYASDVQIQSRFSSILGFET